MRAVVCDGHGDESVLRVGEVPSPTLGPGQVRIRVAAAGVNRADLLQRRGLYPPPPGASSLLGLEVAGQVAEIGEGVADLTVGDRVMALLTGGGYAEEAVVARGCVMRTPERLDDAEAAAVPEVFLTAFLNLFLIGGLERGHTALVHGGSGGVGTAAIELVTRAGARVLVTAGSPERCRRCLELGAAAAVDYHTHDFSDAVKDATGGRGVDVVLDCIGAPYLERHLQLLKPDGRLVVIGLMGGATAEIDLRRLLSQRITVVGSTLRARSDEFKAEMVAAFLDRFGDDLATGAVRPVVDGILSLEEVADAHRALAKGEVFGKVVLRVG